MTNFFKCINAFICMVCTLSCLSLVGANFCSAPLDLIAKGKVVGQVITTLDSETSLLEVILNANPTYTFSSAQAQGGLSSQPVSTIFPLNKNGLPQTDKFFAKVSQPGATSLTLNVKCTKNCTYVAGAEILLAVHANVINSAGKILEVWSPGTKFSTKGTATYTKCVIDQQPVAKNFDSLIFQPALYGVFIRSNIGNLLDNAVGNGPFTLPANTTDSAANGIVTAPAVYNSNSGQFPTYGEIYKLVNGEKQYLPAAVPPEAQVFSEHKAIARVATYPNGNVEIHFDFDGNFPPAYTASDSLLFSEPLYFDYIVKDANDQVSESGTVKMILQGYPSIFTAFPTVKEITDYYEQNPDLLPGLSTVMQIPETGVFIPTNIPVQVINTEQSSGVFLATAFNPLSSSTVSVAAPATYNCQTVNGLQVCTEPAPGPTDTTVIPTNLAGQACSDSNPCLGTQFTSVYLTSSGQSSGGTPVYATAPMQTVTAILNTRSCPTFSTGTYPNCICTSGVNYKDIFNYCPAP